MLNIKRENKFNNFIVAGGYIAQIRGVKNDAANKKLTVIFDITEGEYRGYFKKEYDENISNGWPLKGTQNFDYGNDIGEKALNAFIDNLEQSNSYTFNGDETKFKGLKIGVIYTNTTYQGRDGTDKKGTSFPKFTTVEKIRNGEYSIEEKTTNQSKNDSKPVSGNSFNIGEDDIQF